MTVKELKEKLNNYPDDMIVAVESLMVYVEKATPKTSPIYDCVPLHPSTNHYPHNDSLFREYNFEEVYIDEDNEIDPKYFLDKEVITFKPDTDSVVRIEGKFREAISIMGEWDRTVDSPKEDEFKSKLLKSVLLIS